MRRSQVFKAKNVSSVLIFLRTALMLWYDFSTMILDTILKENFVSLEMTIKLIRKAVESTENDQFLINGFPKTEENRIAFERIVIFSWFIQTKYLYCSYAHLYTNSAVLFGAGANHPTSSDLYFCSKMITIGILGADFSRTKILCFSLTAFTSDGEMSAKPYWGACFFILHVKNRKWLYCCTTLYLFEGELRCVFILLQGRVDDNIDTVKERPKAFRSPNLPVVNPYSNKGVLYKVLLTSKLYNLSCLLLWTRYLLCYCLTSNTKAKKNYHENIVFNTECYWIIMFFNHILFLYPIEQMYKFF